MSSSWWRIASRSEQPIAGRDSPHFPQPPSGHATIRTSCPHLHLPLDLLPRLLPISFIASRESRVSSPSLSTFIYTPPSTMSSDDESGLPLPSSSRSPSPALPLPLHLRKRSYGEASDASSDMPLFSSDDLTDAGIENYATPRNKKQYRRTWWDSESRGPSSSRKEAVKRAAKRAKDSGVFMPSSDSSGMEEGFGHDTLKPVTPPKKRKEPVVISPKRAAQASSRNFIRQVFEEALEDNNEVIDAQ